MAGDAPETAPVLSTPESHAFEDPTPTKQASAFSKLSDEQFYITYEIRRTVEEIRRGGWRRIALQFPDDMLGDAPRVSEKLRQELQHARSQSMQSDTRENDLKRIVEETTKVSLEPEPRPNQLSIEANEEKLTILADTSYGACCVDEIAAEHVDAEAVIHYGRSCLSPTARLPVIYVYTTRPLNLEEVVRVFQQTYPDKEANIILLADLPYHGHVGAVSSQLRAVGYVNLFASSVVHDPSSPIPNRTVPSGALSDAAALHTYSVFHISEPPTSLLMNITSQVASIYIYATTSASTEPGQAIETSTAQILRRRYALVTRLSTEPIFGILINTLSVKNYLSVLTHVKDIISKAGKKYYTFVVGKVNAAKVANFAEIGGWVVIGCWESSLIESKDFWRPIITPYELELALTDEKDRLWTGEWRSDFQAVLDHSNKPKPATDGAEPDEADADLDHDNDNDSEEESEPPVFDLRTGKYVSQSRPMARKAAVKQPQNKTSASLVKRANGDIAQIGGQASPAAEFFRSKRTWQGLGTDHEIAYQYAQDDGAQGAVMEQGRAGIARGYAAGEEDQRT